MKRVMVTGARGFVGRHVLAALGELDVEVHAVASSVPPPGTDRCTWHQADLLDPVQRDRLAADVGADTLLHAAWCAKPPDYWRHPDNLRWQSATAELVRLFTAHGGRRVLGVGTCAEYDWRYGYCTENLTPLAGRNLYSATKAATGQALEAYGAETGLRVAWGRLFFLLGPHDSPVRLVPSLVRDLNAGRRARCTSGSHVRDFLHVEDAASALVALLRSQVTGPVNIASGVPVRLADLARDVAARLGRQELLTIDEGSSEHALVTANVARLRDEVGWKPSRDLSGALDDTVAWWSSAAAQVTA
jgi:nucleoside-diphosphate-sugar epimerase